MKPANRLARVALGNLESHRRVRAFQQICGSFSPARLNCEFDGDSFANDSLRGLNLLWSLAEGESGAETQQKYN